MLGIICMVNEGSAADRKLVVIDEQDCWADELDDVEDVESLLPGLLDQVREWWKPDTTVDAPPPSARSQFVLDSMFMPRQYAMDVIEQSHRAWKKAYDCDLEDTFSEPHGADINPRGVNRSRPLGSMAGA